MRSNASHLIYNLENIASAIKGFSNLFMKKRRNLHVVLNPLLSALISEIERRFIFNIVVAKANKVSTIRKIRYCIMLVYDNEALRDLLLVFMFVFIVLSINIYQYRRSESESLITLIVKSERLLYVESN